MERGSHTNEDSIRKRDQKLNEKQEQQTQKILKVPNSAFLALAASSFQPTTNKNSLESIKKLRAASTSNESGILGQEKQGSPSNQNKDVIDQAKVNTEDA